MAKAKAKQPIVGADGVLLSSGQLVQLNWPSPAVDQDVKIRLADRVGEVLHIEEYGAERGQIDVQFPQLEGYEASFRTLPATVLRQAQVLAAPEPAPVVVQHPIEYLPLDCLDVVRNTRQHYDEAALEELTESVRQHGVQQNVVVRPHPSVPGRYQLAAGHRRYIASQRAGRPTIPAAIRPMTDTQFLELQLLENIQREDVHPADEAVVFAEMLNEHGYTAEEIGARVGKKAKFVSQRAALVKLTPYWMEALRENRLPLLAAYQIAPLPAAAQHEVTKVYAHAGEDGKKRFDARQIRDYISSHILRDLALVAFPKDDATLVPAAGACLTCPKRTAAATTLFPELASKDYCLDGACFALKKQAFVERRQQELTDELGHKPILVSREYSSRQVPVGAVPNSDWSSSEQGKPGSVEALAVDGANAGQIVHVRLTSSKAVSTPESQEQAKQARKDEVRNGRIRTVQCLLITADYYGKLATGTPLPEKALLRYCRGEIIRYGGPHKEMRAYLVEYFGFTMPQGGTDKMQVGVETWVNENLQKLTYEQRLALYFALLAYNEVNGYTHSTTLETYAIAAGTGVAQLRPVAIEIVDGKRRSPGQERLLEEALTDVGKEVANG